MTARDRVTRFDEAVFRLEQRLVGLLFLVMALVVFLDVVHRVFSRAPGRIATFAASLAGSLGIATTPEALDDTLGPLVNLLACFAIAYGALRTRKPDEGQAPMAPKKAAGFALVATVVTTLLVQAFVRGKPDGVVWAPYLALCLLLWVGLIGASMATYAGKHLALEMGGKLWPAAMQPWIRRVASLLAACFCLVLVLLGTMSLLDHYDAWSSSPHAALVPAIDVPKWAVFLVVPYAFGMMSLRLFGRALGLLAPPPAAEEGAS